MARAISVKVATPKVIAALESKLATVESNYANQTATEEAFQIATKQYQADLTAYAIKHMDLATNFRTNLRTFHGACVNIDFDVPLNLEGFPTEPKRDIPTMAEYEYRNIKEEITNALNILKMTDEEYVNASTMKSIASYL